jgi:RNA polymerase sigma-54 factor
MDYCDNLYDVDSDGMVNGALGLAGGGAGSHLGRGGSFDERDSNLEDSLPVRESLRDHLLSQLSMDVSDPVDRLIGVHLIDLLDPSGYLPADLSPVVEVLNCPLERIEATLARLQRFDPPGLFARSLRECLALQLADRGLLDQRMTMLLDHLDLVGRRDWTGLARLLGVGVDVVARLVQLIRSLNPKPGFAFEATIAQPVTPDVIMWPQPSGGWIVELNAETQPRLLVNQHYYVRINRAARSKEDKQYISECLQSANWLIKALHQRATTILKVAAEIVRQQEGFFLHGVAALKPLVLRDIAQAISMHESTVSRVTSNKYMATPRGIYELKYFFTHGVGGSHGGEVHSAEAVRHRLRALIDAEPAEAILSDDALAEILQKDGIDIARRTVAKYREGLGIPSSLQRRREKSRHQ